MTAGLVTLPLAHIGGLSIVYRCLLAGSCCVLNPNPHFRGSEVRSLIEKQRVHPRVSCANDASPLARRSQLDTALPPSRCPDWWGKLFRRIAQTRPSAKHPFLTTYGATETSSQVCTQSYRTAGTLQPGGRKTSTGSRLANLSTRTHRSQLPNRHERISQ